MVTVYFNQWFSSVYNIVADLKNRMGDNISIIMSSKTIDHVYKNVADKFIVEDWIETKDAAESENNYINWLLNTLQDNKVNLFFCKKHMSVVAKNISRFNDIGVKVITEDYDTLLKLNRKSDVYNELHNELESIIPEFLVTKDKKLIKDFIYRSTKQLCMKLDTDEGGASFRKIERSTDLSLESLNKFRVNTLTEDELITFINNLSCSDINKIMFMELLDSPEISVDCYNSKNGFIAIAREKKEHSRVQHVYIKNEIISYCKIIADKYNLQNCFNVQFRYSVDSNGNKRIKLLEINPRLSGGAYYLLLNNINLLYIEMIDKLNLDIDYTDQLNIIKKIDYKVTHHEEAEIVQ